MDRPATVDPVAVELALLHERQRETDGRLKAGAGSMSKMRAMIGGALIGSIASLLGMAYSAGQLTKELEYQGTRIQAAERRLEDVATEQVTLQRALQLALDKQETRLAALQDVLERKLDQALAQQRRRR